MGVDVAGDDRAGGADGLGDLGMRHDQCARCVELAAEVASLKRHAQRLPSYVEQTEAGTINWKMEVERLNRLLANAQSPRKQRRVPVMVPDKNSASGHRVEWLSIDVDSEISSLLDSATLPTPPAQGAPKPSAWRACWVSLNTSRTQLFEIEAEANAKARETGGCVIPLYASAVTSTVHQCIEKTEGGGK